MANNNEDVLLNLLNKHKEANGIPTTEPVKPVEKPVEEITETPEVTVDADTDIEDDDIYGVNDLMKQIEAEEAAEEAERAAAIAARQQQNTKPKELTMPNEKDEEYLTEAVGYQGDKLSTITLMVNKVVAKYRLVSGGIPDAVPVGSRTLPKRAVMGELNQIVDAQSSANPVITRDFEAMILSNWIMPDGSAAIENIDENGVVVDRTITPVANNTQPEEAEIAEQVEQSPAVININVEPNTPVEVNVDNDLIASLTKTKKIDIYVNEISSNDMEASTVIENPDQEGIITTYDPGINDVPITLPLSGYRCVMRGINYLDFIKLSAPSSGNTTDAEIKTWTIIYNHLKNPSIGPFKDFEDFLRKTKYQDREILMWGVLAATLDDQDTISITCGNPNCGEKHTIVYYPRELIHVDETKIPEWYVPAYQAAAGPEAVSVWEQASRKRVSYKLQDSQISVEINEPSAYEFITQKLPLLDELYKRYKPNGSFSDDMRNANEDEPSILERADMLEFNYLSSIAMYLSAVIIERGGKKYRFTKWKDIEKVVSGSLSSTDSSILVSLIEQVRSNTSPVSFRINDVTCPHCKHHDDFIPINNLQEQLLVRVYVKLGNTQINLINMD